jgi:hypothetical protein
MNDIGLDELLTRARRGLQALAQDPSAGTRAEGDPLPSEGRAPETGAAPEVCLPFARARALTLNPDRWEPEERAHAAGCRRCARLLASFERQMPHLSLWSLVRRQLSRLAEDERRAVAYHLEAGECQHCRAREDRLRETLDRIVQFPAPLALPDPAFAGAATACLAAGARSSGGTLEAELFEEEGLIRLEVRTKDAALNHRLVGYALRGTRREDALEGFLVLRPDVEGWLTAHASFDPGEIYFRLRGRCEEVLISPILVDVLSTTEREALLASVMRGREDAAARAEWTAWATEMVQKSDRVSDQAWQLLCEVRACLEMPSG